MGAPFMSRLPFPPHRAGVTALPHGSAARSCGARSLTSRGWSLLALLCLVSPALSGCGHDEESAKETSAPPIKVPPKATSLTFVPTTTLMLEPLEAKAVNVVAGPPGGNGYTVRFALLPDGPNSDPNDASLDRLEAVTDEDGIATVIVTAPSGPSTFTLRASIDDELEKLLPVSVSENGYGTLVVEANYLGTRPIESWVSSVRIGSSCADLSGFPPADGALVATADEGKKLTIESVPIGPIAAVGVRAGKFAYGCVTVDDLAPDEKRTITVDVTDRPLNLEEGNLALGMSIDMTTEEWTGLLEAAIEVALSAFRGQAATDSELLLREMRAHVSPANQVAFDEQTATPDSSSVIGSYVGQTALRDAAADWLARGAKKLSESGSFEGQLTFDGSSATFELQYAGGVDATSSGFLGTSTWTTFADPGDTLVMGGTLRFQATRWVTALADAPAAEDYPEALTVAEALARVVDCEALGKELAAASGGVLFAGCPAACVVNLCESALVTVWTGTQDADTDLSRLSVAATGLASVDDEAHPISLDGSWLGTLGDGYASSIGGEAQGALPEKP